MSTEHRPSVDEALLADLAAADEAMGAGLGPGRDAVSETLDTLPIDGLSGYIGLLRRLGQREAGPDPEAEAACPPRLGRFEIRGTLGQGGFGIVYLARDPTLGRLVALKVPRPEVIISAEARRRFLREARAAAGLDHPNLVAVHEAGEEGPLCYIASTYCPGMPLSRWLKARTGPVRPEVAARLVAALADAVQHAHDRGILHRDIKPSNVILTSSRCDGSSSRPGDEAPARSVDEEDPIPRLTDFGLARINDEVGEETRTGVTLGSPPYMAPEQAAGRNREVGPATDVYALGATLYEILTGGPPFRGETPTETLRLVLESDCVALRILRPGLPRDLEVICLKCLSRDPSRRYASAGALRDDLRRYLAHEPILARPPSVGHRVRRWARRRPGVAALAALAALVAPIVTAGLVHRNALVSRHARELERQVERADASERLARRHLKAFELRQASDALDANQVERAQGILRQSRSAARRGPGRSEAQGFAWDYLMARASRDVLVLSERSSERISEVCLSPDGRSLATGDEDGTVRLRDPDTGAIRTSLAGHKFGILRLVFSPSGRLLASVGRGSSLRTELFVWDVNQARLLERLEVPTQRAVEEVRFDPTGDFLWELAVFDRGQFRIRLWSLAAGTAGRRLLWTRPTATTCPPLSHDGSLVALEEEDRRFVVRDVRGAERGRTGVLEPGRHLAAPSPDGRLLAIASQSGSIAVWDFSAGRERTRFEHPGAEPGRLLFTPDGLRLICTFRSGACVVHELTSGVTRTIDAPGPDPDLNAQPRLSPDGRLLALNLARPDGIARPTQIWQFEPWGQLASYPGTPGKEESHAFDRAGTALFVGLEYEAVRWNFAGVSEVAQPAGHSDEAWSLAFSPDGSILATGSDDDDPQTIRLWDVATGRQVRGWNGGVGTVGSLSFHPSGQVLASGHLTTPGHVRLWDPASGRLLATLPGHADSVRSVVFSPDGKLLATAGSDRTVRLWDAATRRCLRVLTGHEDTVRFVAFSPDGHHLASVANDRTVRIWDLASGAAEKGFPWLEKIAAVAYSPDGDQLAAAGENGLITLWDLATGARVQTVDDDDKELRCLAFCPDGQLLATAGKSRRIRLWDPVTDQELLTLEGHAAQINALAFSPDGATLASCSHDGVVRIWRSGKGR